MFDVGFSEIVLLMVIGLLVLGPERLPRVARTLGAYLRKARTAWNQVKYDIDRELNASELRNDWRKTVADASQDIDTLRADTVKGIDKVQHQIDDGIKDLRESVDDSSTQQEGSAQATSDQRPDPIERSRPPVPQDDKG